MPHVCSHSEVLINDTHYAAQNTGELPTGRIRPCLSLTYPSCSMLNDSFLDSAQFSEVANILIRSMNRPLQIRVVLARFAHAQMACHSLHRTISPLFLLVYQRCTHIDAPRAFDSSTSSSDHVPGV